MIRPKKSSLLLLPAILFCMHLMFAISSWYFYQSFQSDLESRAAEYALMRPRLQDIDETQLNKDMVTRIMSGNMQDSTTFVELFKTLAEIGALASLLSIASLIQIYRRDVAAK